MPRASVGEGAPCQNKHSLRHVEPTKRSPSFLHRNALAARIDAPASQPRVLAGTPAAPIREGSSVTRPPVRVHASCLRLPRAAHHSMCMEITQLLFSRASAISERMSSPRFSLHRCLLFFSIVEVSSLSVCRRCCAGGRFSPHLALFPHEYRCRRGYGSSFRPGRCVLIFLAFSGMWVAGRFGFV